MGLLDELQSRVDEIELKRIKQDSELEAQELFYVETLRPVMVDALGYLSDIVGKLNIVAPEIKPGYSLNPLVKKPIYLSQKDYHIDFDNEDNPRQIDIYFSCSLDQPQTFYVTAKDTVDSYKDLLNSYSFDFQHKNHLDKRFQIRGTTFFLEGPMRVHIQIRAGLAERCVHVVLRNLDEQPIRRYRFSPEELNTELIKRLAQVLVREEEALVITTVSEEYRIGLRRQIREESLRKEQEDAKSFPDLESHIPVYPSAKIAKRARKVVAKKLEAVFAVVRKA